MRFNHALVKALDKVEILTSAWMIVDAVATKCNMSRRAVYFLGTVEHLVALDLALQPNLVQFCNFHVAHIRRWRRRGRGRDEEVRNRQQGRLADPMTPKLKQ